MATLTWTDHALSTLQAEGYRRGGARTAVVEYLGAQHCAVTAHDIDDELRKDGRGVGRASIYRVLDLLAELGLASRIEVGQGMARYERIEPSGDHHHHMICDACGDVLPFEDRELERALAHLSRKLSFEIADHEVLLHGACKDCKE
jgi:Fur family transcriptional regulator, ferric uptake regulator